MTQPFCSPVQASNHKMVKNLHFKTFQHKYFRAYESLGINLIESTVQYVLYLAPRGSNEQ